MRFVHNAPESAIDHRYEYHWRVLRAALEATRAEWGDYVVESAVVMTETRQIHEMKRGSARINVMVLDPNADIEATLLPVRVPIDRGLLGYRVLLIRADDQARFDRAETLSELRGFVIGQGADWSDLKVYANAGFETVGGSSYAGLFDMLMAGRFDAFARGVSEVADELEIMRDRHPGMAIERNILLYYPLPVYFWFQNTPDGRRKKQRVEQGMWRLIGDGSLVRMFNEAYGATIDRLELKRRRLFRFDNPNLVAGQPDNDPKLWYQPAR